MDTTSLIVFLLIGLVAGWLAGMLLKGGGLGLVGNIIVGIVGSFIGGFLFKQLGIKLGGDIPSAVITATVGAVVLLLIIGLVRKS